MPAVDIVVSSPIRKTFRVDQVAGMFDLKLDKTAKSEFHADLPELDEDWRIGIIVGPSGSGKSTIARHAFGDALCGQEAWPADMAVVDGFGDCSIKDITHALSAVGFSSPPSWVKPYAVLSNGEKFRCDLARALLSNQKLVVYDEFTSVVDRTVAKIGSAAVSKAIRKNRIAKRFVAVTCHYDVAEWLEPDWVLDMASGRLARGCLRRPKIRLEVAPVHYSAWELFRRHHYLNTKIQHNSRCFCAFIDNEPIAFSAWLHGMTRDRRAGDMREHRTVVLPDYQGIGVGNRLSEFCAGVWKAVGGRASSTTSHPAMIRYRTDSPLWHRHRFGIVSRPTSGLFLRGRSLAKAYPGHSGNRVTGGFSYIGPAQPVNVARALVAATVPANIILYWLRARPGATAAALARWTWWPLRHVKAACARLVAERKIAGRSVGGHRVFYPME